MKLPSHPVFNMPASLLWLLPLLIVQLLFLQFAEIGSMWWYVASSPFVVLAFPPIFTSVWFGISTLAILFVYCSIGSAGMPVSIAIWEPTAWFNLREMRGLEMTEFEWFHWWPFKVLVTILCLNMTTVTLLRIPLNILSAGVWSIHGGVILMVLGSVVYFSNKVEGDVLVSRCRVVIEGADGEQVSMVVTPNNTVTVEDTVYTISNINPNWELMSGDDAGDAAYAVSVSVDGPTEQFTRQLIMGYPEYTEDVVRTNDPQQPMARAKKVLGRPLVNEELAMRLTPDTKSSFLITQSASLYIREISNFGEPLSPWIERPIDNLPRFNDYIADLEDVWISDTGVGTNPIYIPVPQQDPSDPVGQEAIVRSYLRYAYMDGRIVTGSESVFPAAWLTLRKNDGVEQTVRLFAFDPSLNTSDTSIMSFEWVGSDVERLKVEQLMIPSLKATIGNEQFDLNLTSTEEFSSIEGTDYSYRVKSIQNNLHISNNTISLVEVEIQNDEARWIRWVFDNKELNRDVVEENTHDAAKFVDTNISMEYNPGGTPITLVGGQGDETFTLLTSMAGEPPASHEIIIGSPVSLTEEVSITLDRVEEFTQLVTRPAVIPKIQRDPLASNAYSMILVDFPSAEGNRSAWLQYHPYPFESEFDAVRRFDYMPTRLALQDERIIELLYSRSSHPLPSPLSLERFEVDTLIGGFSGRTSSILNWRSIIQFYNDEKTHAAISVNDPKEHEGFWFFQSQWDPPDTTSAGLNYTVLGVGNRYGVVTMLLGCCLTVSGMIWAFFVKPMIKRKRQQRVYAGVAA
ncbi:MAG: hypothetical protein VX436_01265 [Planctomycetota bacterium]|nr:hypothetical protein [Planctomycetota bacterium]